MHVVPANGLTINFYFKSVRVLLDYMAADFESLVGAKALFEVSFISFENNVERRFLADRARTSSLSFVSQNSTVAIVVIKVGFGNFATRLFLDFVTDTHTDCGEDQDLCNGLQLMN